MSNETKKNNIFPVIIVFIVLALVVAIISVVHNYTTKKFEDKKYIDNLETFMKVMPGNYEFVLLKDSIFSSLKENKLKVYKAIDEGKIEGYCINITVIGHDGEISLLAGISTSGVINDVEVLYFNETPNIGTKALTKDYLDYYKGLNYPLEFSKEETGLNAISGATITSDIVKEALNKALLAVTLAKESEGLN